MDAVTLAVATSGVVALASKVFDGAASEAGKSLWKRLQELLGFQKVPPPDILAQAVAEKLKDDTTLTSSVLKELQSEPQLFSGQLVGRVNAEKVVIIGQQNVSGGFSIDM